MKFHTILGCICCLLLGYTQPIDAQIFKRKSDNVAKEKPAKKNKTIKPYSKVITKEAQTMNGLITSHKVDSKYYFEIGDSLLNKEILVVSRISGFVKNLNFGGAGTKARPQQVIRFQKKDDKILIREVSYNSVASEEKPIYESVRNNNFEPVIAVIPISAYGPKKKSYVFDVQTLFSSDVPMFGAMYDFQRKQFGVRSLDSRRSFIDTIRSFPKNVEVRNVLTYTGGSRLPDNQITGTLSVELNHSFILLPEIPHKKRQFDPRVGYFSISQVDYGSEAQKADAKRYITRWKLVPKDKEAYLRGELVEPVNPIVYYIDPATPDEWKPYLKQGVDDWKEAFEAAGFKNAIEGRYAPTKEEDPHWTPEDVRYSTIRYVSTDIQNAMGPHVHDPRTGQIIESDIIWYHNVMKLLRNWFFIQTAAYNKDAQSPTFKKEVMGQLIRFVAAHEVGHTLGLPHNMGSSSAYSIDSLRTPGFVQRMGTAPSIMDYARFNYVAQPEDGDVGIHPKIGPYDIWSIKYGYLWFGDDLTEEEEKAKLNALILEKKDDPIYRFGRQRGLALDPNAQTEDLSDDPIRASDLGIRNLKRIVPQLLTWTKEDGKQFGELDDLYQNVIAQFNRYMGHVTTNIGGVHEHYKSFDENEPVYSYVPKNKQRASMMFIGQHLFKTPTWLIETNILHRIKPSGVSKSIKSAQTRTLSSILGLDRQVRIIENAAIYGDEAYDLSTLYDDLYSTIINNTSTDSYSRNLQQVFVEKLLGLVKAKNAPADVVAHARMLLDRIVKEKSAVSGTGVQAAHFKNLVSTINHELYNK